MIENRRFAVGDGPFSGGYGDIFVAKLDPTGSVLQYAGFLGGDDADSVNGLDVDAQGRIYGGLHDGRRAGVSAGK